MWKLEIKRRRGPSTWDGYAADFPQRMCAENLQRITVDDILRNLIHTVLKTFARNPHRNRPAMCILNPQHVCYVADFPHWLQNPQWEFIVADFAGETVDLQQNPQLQFCNILIFFYFYIRIFCSEFRTGKSATKSHWNLHDLVWICHCRFTWGNAAVDNPQHLCPMCKDLKRGPVSSSDRSVLAYTCIFHKRTSPGKKIKIFNSALCQSRYPSQCMNKMTSEYHQV